MVAASPGAGRIRWGVTTVLDFRVKTISRMLGKAGHIERVTGEPRSCYPVI